MTDIPANAVYGKKAPNRLFLSDAFDSAQEFTAGETELLDEGVGHGY